MADKRLTPGEMLEAEREEAIAKAKADRLAKTRQVVKTEDCPVYLKSQGKKWSPYITPDQYPCNKCPFRSCRLALDRKEHPEYDPQAEEVGWYLEHGWLPPAEAEKLKETLKHRLDRPELREEISLRDFMHIGWLIGDARMGEHISSAEMQGLISLYEGGLLLLIPVDEIKAYNCPANCVNSMPSGGSWDNPDIGGCAVEDKLPHIPEGLTLEIDSNLPMCPLYVPDEAEIRKQERKRIMALYENMGCVPEDDNCYYQFWQALKESE